MLKWAGDEATTWIQDLFNKAIETGMPEEWKHNWIKPIHKIGDRSIANNYQSHALQDEGKKGENPTPDHISG